MIVDDSSYFLNAARCLLEGEGIMVVSVASDSAQALQQATQLRPDIALVDIDLGSESGLELAERLRHEAGPSPPPVILISSHAEDEYADLIVASPALGFLAKTALSSGAIHDLLARRDDGHRDAPVTEPPER